MVRFVEMYGYWCFSFDMCITYNMNNCFSTMIFVMDLFSRKNTVNEDGLYPFSLQCK